MTKVRGVFAQIGANGRFAPRRAMAFVEDQVENLVHGVEPLDELRGIRRFQRDVVIDQVSSGALESFLDRFFVDQERASDFGDAETAQCFQRQCELVFSGQRGMAAGEDHPKLAVFDRPCRERDRRFPSCVGRPVQPSSRVTRWLNLGAPQRIEDLVLGDAVDPGRGLSGIPRAATIGAPRAEWPGPSLRRDRSSASRRNGSSTATSRPASRRKKCSTRGATGSGCAMDIGEPPSR